MVNNIEQILEDNKFLLEQNNMLEDLFHKINAGIVLADSELNILKANPSAQDFIKSLPKGKLQFTDDHFNGADESQIEALNDLINISNDRGYDFEQTVHGNEESHEFEILKIPKSGVGLYFNTTKQRNKNDEHAIVYDMVLNGDSAYSLLDNISPLVTKYETPNSKEVLPMVFEGEDTALEFIVKRGESESLKKDFANFQHKVETIKNQPYFNLFNKKTFRTQIIQPVENNKTETYHVEITVTAENEEGKIIYQASHRDVTDLLQEKARLVNKLSHDELTGLLNEPAFKTGLYSMMESVEADDFVYLANIDVKNFKPINDILGHATGDYVLKKIGEALEKSVREDDLVARFHGDEFYLGIKLSGEYLQDKSPSAVLKNIIGRVKSNLGKIPYSKRESELVKYDFNKLQEIDFENILSLGVSRYPDDVSPENTLIENDNNIQYDLSQILESNYESLMTKSDMAMYVHKYMSKEFEGHNEPFVEYNSEVKEQHKFVVSEMERKVKESGTTRYDK